MKTKLIYLLLIIVSFSSCLQRDETDVNKPCEGDCINLNGTISTGESSNEPVEEAYIELGWSIPGTPIGNLGRLIATTKTDDHGNFGFEFKPDSIELEKGEFYINISKNDFYKIEKKKYFLSQIDSIYYTKIHLQSKANIEFKLHNFYPQKEGDIFHVETKTLFEITESGDKKYSGVSYELFDDKISFDDKIIKGETAGDQLTIVEVDRVKNGERTETIDSLFIRKGETFKYKIEY